MNILHCPDSNFRWSGCIAPEGHHQRSVDDVIGKSCSDRWCRAIYTRVMPHSQIWDSSSFSLFRGDKENMSNWWADVCRRVVMQLLFLPNWGTYGAQHPASRGGGWTPSMLAMAHGRALDVPSMTSHQFHFLVSSWTRIAASPVCECLHEAWAIIIHLLYSFSATYANIFYHFWQCMWCFRSSKFGWICKVRVFGSLELNVYFDPLD